MTDKTDDLDQDSLSIGDLVLFQDVARNLILSVDGILLEDVLATDGINLQDSLFCVHLKHEYSASRDLNSFLAEYDMDIKKIEEESAKKFLKALQRGVENEKKLNDTYMNKKYGQKVSFGDTIQLFHMKSRKYLTVIPDRLAKVERENVYVTLDVIGNSFSWLQICPRYKIDKEGDRILNNSEMYLRVASRANEYFHTSDRDSEVGYQREVNCALELTSWRLIKYQSSADALDTSLLLASQLVIIQDPETLTNLTIQRDVLENLEDGKKLLKSSYIPLDGSAVLSSTTTSATNELSEGFDDMNNIDDDAKDIILEPENEGFINSNHYWYIEAHSLLVGGPILWKTDLIRFKHMNSDLYLKYQVLDDNDSYGGNSVIFTTTSNPYVQGTLFLLNELNGVRSYLSNSKAVQIGNNNNNYWMERGDNLEDEVFTYKVNGTRDKVSALSFMIHRCAAVLSFVDDESNNSNSSNNSSSNNNKSSNSSTDNKSLSNNEPLDVLSGIECRYYLNKYHDMIVIPRSDSVNTIWPTAISSDLEFFNYIIDKNIYFSQGFLMTLRNIKLGIDKADTALRIRRQHLVREQGILEVTIRMINKLIPITQKFENIKIQNANKKKKNITPDEVLNMLNMGQRVLRRCFDLLYYCILDCNENQLYVADHMPSLLAHLNTEEMAGKTVAEMLSKNVELQETKIGTREIQIFVDKLRSSKMNAMYLKLLQACCSCEGDGIDANQGNIATMLFSNTSDVIIDVHADFSRITPVVWESPSLYIPAAPIPGSPVRGISLINKGLPQLSLSWTTSSIEFSPLGLFGKLSVNVEELFKIEVHNGNNNDDNNNNNQVRKVSNKKKSSNDQKKAVAEYFVAQMYLGAEMCMDRNYNGMHVLDDLFTYEILVTIMKLNVSPKLKSAAVRLLMYLHVDRDPQMSTKIPRLTRVWSEIRKNPEPKLPYVDPSTRFTFGMVHQLISEHVRNMAGNPWDEYSRHILTMLRFMVQFNFYGTIERMKDVIGPLIFALDRRAVNNDTSDTITSNYQSKNKNNTKVEDIDTVDDENSDMLNIFKKAKSATNAEDSKETGGLNEISRDDSGLMTLDNNEDEVKVFWNSSIISALSSFYNFCFNFRSSTVTITDADPETFTVEGFKEPARYSKAPIYELETMVEAVDILAFVQTVIEDRNLSLLLRYFYLWENGTDTRSPAEIFEQVVIDSKQLTLDIADFDNVMIDVLMYVHTPLIQSTLEVLMAHHSKRQMLLDNASSVQLLASHKRERQYKMIDQMLQQLYQNAETHELWCDIGNDADLAVNKQTKDIMRELTDICRVQRVVLEFDEEYMADKEIQDLYRNLSCFDYLMKILSLFVSVEEGLDDDGNLSPGAANTKDLCLLGNNLLYWFFLSNPKNQELGYEELEFFIDNLDAGINCHLVIKAIFKDNETLMRQVPHSYLADLVEKIIQNGQSHHYLSLLASISHVGERNITENQFEIVTSLISPGRLQKVACFLVPIDHPDYEEKRELMKPFLDDHRDFTLDELPLQLAYHLMFLEVLSGCTVGRLNVTAVEAKVQAVFSHVHIIESILDEGTILIAKIITSRFLFNAIIDVELTIPGLERCLPLWKLMDSYKVVIQEGRENLLNAVTYGWGSPEVYRQKIEYMLVCIMIIGGFFSFYFDLNLFKGSETSKTGEKFNKATALKLIVTFYDLIKEVYDIESIVLNEEMKVMMRNTLETLRILSPKILLFALPERNSIVKDVKSTTEKKSNKEPKEDSDGHIAAVRSRSFSAMRSFSMKILPSIQNSVGNDDYDSNDDNSITSTSSNSPYKNFNGEINLITISKIKKNTSKTDEVETRLVNRYKEFIEILKSDENVIYKADNENVAFIGILEKLPFEADPVDSDVRYETLIKKLVSHIRENISVVANQKRLDPRVSKTSAWIIRAFRTMIENRMGMSIYERDEDGGKEQDEAAAPVVNALNSCGATVLCLDLIADGIDDALQLEAIKLGVGLLFKEGGAMDVQSIMNNHLMKTQSSLFFKQVQITLHRLQEWHTWNGAVLLSEGKEPSLPDEILLLRFLQLMSEGHYLPNQDIMREQPNNPVSYNLLDDFVSYLNCLSRLPCRTSSTAAIRLSATILEVIQGPCSGNQAHFAFETELVEALNRLNRAKLTADCIIEEEVQLKQTSIDIFQALTEGQGNSSPVFERILSVIHLDIIQVMSKRQTLTDLDDDNQIHATEEQIILQTECFVLLLIFCSYRPTLYDELGISRNVEDIVGSGTAMIEVIWRGDIHRRFFHIPKICDFLAKKSKDDLVENIDRSNAENKLIDFLARSHNLYREIKHQQLLTELGISGIFSSKVQNYATWLCFGLTVVINLLFTIYYDSRSSFHDDYRGVAFSTPFLSSSMDLLTTSLNAIQACIAFFTLVLWIVIRSPINYLINKSTGADELTVIYMTATESLTVYYVIYLIISLLGVFQDNYFCSLLLLDIIVKNSTTRDVLNSIVYPWRQLMMACLLQVFVVYIFAFYLFYFYQADASGNCTSLWACCKFTFSYGFQNGGGISDSLSHTQGIRLVFDILFFAMVLIILLNVIFGIIIDTFGSLRNAKAVRERDTSELCFICGIEKQTFDRASDEPNGFLTHIKIDHNMWNYLYFIVLLWEQDKDDDDGLELYVRRAIEADEITWFPIRKAMRLNQIVSPTEILRSDLKGAVQEVETSLDQKLDEFQVDLKSMFQQLLSSLQHDSSSALPSRNQTPAHTKLNVDDNVSNLIDYGFHVSLGIARIEDLKLSTDDLMSVSCRIIAESGIYLFTCVNDIQEGIVYFNSNIKSCLIDNITMEDERMFQLQILYGPSKLQQFITSINIPWIDIVNMKTDESSEFKFTFAQSSNDDDESANAGSIYLTSISEPAQSIGR